MNPTNTTRYWKAAGIIATAIIVVLVPLSGVLEKYRARTGLYSGPVAQSMFVGSAKCKDCHKPEYDKWKGSHHERAMDHANAQTVLGNFDGTVFRHFGVESRFYRKEDRFYVRTPGPEGKMGDFQILYTFGYFPLQQYLIAFPGGKLQCLPIAWDVRNKKWFHLYPDENIPPDDWLYWTNQSQNWNGMCAECHSTDLRKNFDPETGDYKTTWSEISVGCEACHGPASLHVQWAELPEMGRPDLENAGLQVRTAGLGPKEQVAICAPCHSRRMSLADNIHRHADYLDYGVPQLLSEGFYFADGQILEEVYVYGSFMQSKMAERGVRCSDCHDVHSIKRLKPGNDLCLQCHKKAVYDRKDHHFHKLKGEPGNPILSKSGEVVFDVGTGAECEQCHMPGRIYMGVDYRLDHSFRIPSPSLSAELDSPNACTRCHVDKSLQWAEDSVRKWYGEKKRFHYGTVISRGRRGESRAEAELADLAQDRLYPAIVRATALQLLSTWSDPKTESVFSKALTDEEAIVRHTAIRHFPEQNPEKLVQELGPLLYDSVKAVRIEAAARLAGLPERQMPSLLKRKFDAVFAEYVKALERTADFAPSRHNLGNLYARIGDMERAVSDYERAIRIDNSFYPAKVNLATLYNQRGENRKAETLLKEVLAQRPDLYEVDYSLGLLLAEMEKYPEAEAFLAAAARGLPKRERIFYNLALVRQHLGMDAAAELAFNAAHGLNPKNGETLYALAVFYLQRYRLAEAKQTALKLIGLETHRTMGEDLLKIIEKMGTGSLPGNE
jgi:tetratricopeptide (TPR) repeat protein